MESISPSATNQEESGETNACNASLSSTNGTCTGISHGPSTVFEAATTYSRLGWSVLPIPFRSKNPGFKGWEQTRLKEGDLPSRFNGHPQNIGVLLGEPSGWLIDIDLDHKRCVELAEQCLPHTPAIFGRPGKPRSHWLYTITESAPTKKFNSKSAGMLVEFRSTGMQTIFPPSTHEGGELISWEAEDAKPAVVTPADLLAAVEALATAVKIELGEKSAPKLNKTRDRERESPNKKIKGPTRSIASAIAAMLRMSIVDQNDGSGRLFAAACRCVETDLSDPDALSAIHDYAKQKPFPRDWTDEEILARVRDAERKVQRGVIRRAPSRPGKPTVLIDVDEHRVIAETNAALASDPELFHRGNMLVRVLHDGINDGITRSAGTMTISAAPPAYIRERATLAVDFTRQVRQDGQTVEVSSHPTAWLINGIHARGSWPKMRYLTGLSDAPILRPDGSIFQTAGYDSKTGFLYSPNEIFPPIPQAVTLDDADAAAGSLLEIVSDFRFEAGEHKAAWLAALLSPLARCAFDGPAPLFLIDANVRGAGKGLLAQTIGQIVMGREMPVSSYAHDSEEMRKKITSIALAGDRMIHLDNIGGAFGNDALDRALTTTRWKDRILGKNEQVDLPLIAIWYGTGNNVIVAADTCRRIIHIRLDVLEERPEDRTGFLHPNLVTWIRANRPRLLTSALTILSAYLRAGRPAQSLSPYGSFEGWSEVVRGAVTWVGLPDPCLTRTKLAEFADSSADALGQLLQAWNDYDPNNAGLAIADLLPVLYPRVLPPADAASTAMRIAIETFAACPPGKVPTARQLGNKLKHVRRRVFSGKFFDVDDAQNRSSGAVWKRYTA